MSEIESRVAKARRVANVLEEFGITPGDVETEAVSAIRYLCSIIESMLSTQNTPVAQRRVSTITGKFTGVFLLGEEVECRSERLEPLNAAQAIGALFEQRDAITAKCEALHGAVYQAVSIMLVSFDVAQSAEAREARDILRSALIAYADAAREVKP